MKNKIIKYTLFVMLALCFSSPAASASEITVKKGDSLWLIAKRYKVSFDEVLEINKHFQNPNMIHIGDKVTIPNGSNGTATSLHSQKDNIMQGNNQHADGSVSDIEEQVFQLVNKERKSQGLNELTLSSKLTSIAEIKANDMSENNYFSHTSPTYGTPFQMLQHFGVTYKSAGENIAAGQQSAQQVMESWMNSSGHRANILNPSYTEIGIGYTSGGSYKTEWVQLFIGS